jgi:hypothetical protein
VTHTPDTPRYCAQLEAQLNDAAVGLGTVAAVPATPRYEAELDSHIADTPRQPKRDRLLFLAIAAAGAAVVALAGILA